MASTLQINQQEALLLPEEEEEELLEQPLSPKSLACHSDVLSISILVFLELENGISDDIKIEHVQHHLQRMKSALNPRFSSIVIRDENGVRRWRKTKLIMEDHIKIPIFPTGLSPKDYDKHLEDYINKIHMEGFIETQPLWEVHVIRYPTSNAQATMVFKLHHALGDGFSLMGVLLSCFQRADDPSLPFTFPGSTSSSSAMKNQLTLFDKACQFVSGCWNTVLDLGEMALLGILRENDRTAIRSGKQALEFEPTTISSVSFSLQDIALVKSKVGGTVNDIVVAITFYGIRLYMQKMGQASSGAKNVTAFVLLNTRMLTGYQNVEEMAKANTYGNRISFMYLRVPSCSDVEKLDPMEFVFKAKKILKRKKNSMVILFTSRLIQLLRNIQGPKGVARRLYSEFVNASLTISNMAGPKEKVAVAGFPIKGYYFVSMGMPQSLGVFIMSYMGQLRLAVRVEKDFIDSELLVSCMKEAFQNIFESSCAK